MAPSLEKEKSVGEYFERLLKLREEARLKIVDDETEEHQVPSVRLGKVTELGEVRLFFSQEMVITDDLKNTLMPDPENLESRLSIL